MNNEICEGISNKNIISFYYDNELRIVEPHCHGITAAGNEELRAFQTEGFSKSGKYGWKMYDLSKSRNIKITDDHFNVRTGYKTGDKGMRNIYCEI